MNAAKLTCRVCRPGRLCRPKANGYRQLASYYRNSSHGFGPRWSLSLTLATAAIAAGYYFRMPQGHVKDSPKILDVRAQSSTRYATCDEMDMVSILPGRLL